MTLNLKLVRHQDGKWKALTPETDGIVQVTERKSAPIDPAQLLKALDSLLSVDGGIRSIEDVPRLASLMKKFSKKLVSRCVYCNVLQATKPEILSEYLDKGGWETINTWLQYAKSSSSASFLIEMLKLCKLLPMTLNRLKENNTAKLIKSLTKHENSDVKEISSLLVNQWMSIIKEKKNVESSGEKKKKKDKPDKSSKAEKVESKIEKVESKVEKTESKVEKTESKVEKTESQSPKEVKSPPKLFIESPKGPIKSRSLKRTSLDKESKSAEIYEDVKIDPASLMPLAKKSRPDRPKTVKIYQKKFRATGLEEEMPLPKNILKKTATVDKSAVAAAKSTLKLNTSPLDRITEKKIKPENLLAVNENTNTKGIKLIPAKPRPTILHESSIFIDALTSQPVAPIKRKKKVSPKQASTTPQPTSPTITAPKLEFYKDTLEEKMNENKIEENNTNDAEDSEKKDEENKDPEDKSENKSEIKSENSTTDPEEVSPMEVSEEGGHTPPNEEIVANQSPNENFDFGDEVRPQVPFDPNNLRSILSHGKRRGKKKSVKWVDDSHIKEVFYFEMDDTERVNVSRNSNFYDLKFIEMRRERETMEQAKRQSGDRVEEFRRWWDVPVLIDIPPALVVPGCQSQEKHVEHLRQQSTLQEIYFTKEMIPDSPHEPDLEIVAQKEPKIIPLDEDNVISTLTDYSNYMPIKPSLPEILSKIMKLNANQLPPLVTQNVEPVQVPMETEPMQPPLVQINTVNQPNLIIPPNLHNQPGPEPLLGPPNGLLGHIPAPYQSPPPDIHGPEIPGEWQVPPPPLPLPPQDMPPNDFFPGFQVNQNMPSNHPPPGMNIRGGPPPGGNNYRPNFRGAPRGMPSRGRSRVICRHFAAGHCRFGASCSFLHPGVNGPHL